MKLKPCAMCDFAKPRVIPDDTWGIRSYLVYCPECLETLEMATKRDAIAEWNRVYEELRTESEKLDRVEGMCCDCIQPDRHSVCGDYSENDWCDYKKDDGSCWK